MAPRQITDILVRLGIEGLQGLDKVSSAFKDLQKTLDGPTTSAIERVRRSINEYSDASARSEQLIKGQLEALRGLKTQADINSATYRRLNDDINRLETEMRGTTAAIDQQRQAVLASTSASERNADALRRQIQAFGALQQQTRPGSSAFAQLGRDIETARTRLTGLTTEAQQFSRTLTAGFGATPERLASQISILRRGMAELRFDSEQYLQTLERIQLLSMTQAGRTGRANVIAGFRAYQSREFTAGYADPSRLPDLPNTTAALEQQLSELSAQLNNVERGSADYTRVSMQMAAVQRELRTELLGTAEAFNRLNIAQAGAERRAAKLETIQEYYRTQGPMAPGVGGFRDPATGAMIARGARTQDRIRVQEQAYARPIGPEPFPEAARRAEEAIERSLNDVNKIYENARVQRAEIQSRYDNLHIEKLLEGLDLEGRLRQKSFDDELAAFDRQLEARDRRRRGRITPGQAVQTAGAVISGGIFGGPEGFLGGLGGAALGASIPGLGIVGGAFAGSAAGAQLGMFRQQIAGTADYAAQIGKLQIALRGIVGNQDDYNRAIAAAASVTRDLNVPQTEATRGLTRLSAAVLGAGGNVNDSIFAFRSMTEAIKATGGGAEQVDGALLALTQVFSKGKVSAEELNQIAERLPGTFTLFAQATGRTGPELQKALEQGQVGLNDLMKFLELAGGRYGQTALKIAKSSEDAGARLNVAFNDMRLNVGKALQPLGAQLQEVFTGFLVSITPALTAIARALPSLVDGFRKAYQQGGILKGVVDGLVGSLVVFAGLQVFGAFIAGARAAITVTGALIKALRALTAANLLAGAAGFLKSKPGAIAALIAGLGVGIDAAFNEGKIVKGIASGITGAIDQAFSGLGAMMPEIPALDLSGGRTNFRQGAGGGGRDDKAAARERKDLFNELLNQLNAQNEVLAKQGRLNESVAETEWAKAGAALFNAEEILRNEQAQLDLRLKFGEVSKKVYDEQQKAIKLEGQTVRQEFNKTVKKLKEEADALLKEVTGPGGVAGPTETPLQRASREITEDIAKRRARALQIGGVAGQAAFEGLGALDVRQIASRQVAGPMIADLEKQIRDLQRMGQELSTLDQLKQEFLGGWDTLDPVLRRQLELLAAQKDALVKQTQAAKDMKQLYSDIGTSIKDGVVSAIQGAIDGTKSLQQVASDLLNSIANRLLDVAINLALFGVMSGTGTGGGLLGGLFKPNAMGNAYAKNGIVPFAYGGVVNRPTLFPFAKGIGLMGEAGPEAILPLRRGSDGRLGVSSSGGGSTVVNVSVDASGTAVEGDGPGANQMGRIIGAAVQAEIVKMQRPGGLLANTR
jgi:tape measure domain-containing protein